MQKFLGSVSAEISNYSKTPTFISKGEADYTKILLALDDSLESSNIVKWTIRNLNFENKEIYLVTVFENPDFVFLDGTLDRNWYIKLEEKERIYYSKILNQHEQMFLYNNIQIKDKIVLNGNKSSEIVRYANNNDINLVIYEQKKRSNLARILLSSVSQQLLDEVKSGILIIK